MQKFILVLVMILVLAIIGGGAYGYLKINQRFNDQSRTIDDLKTKLAKQDTNTEQTTGSSTALPQTYNSTSSGFQISYPESWSTTQASSQESDEGTIETVHFKDENGNKVVTVAVQPASMEGVLKESFEIKQTTIVTIDNVSSQKLKVLDNQSGKKMFYYLAKKSGKLYTFSAAETNATTLEKMVNSFKFPTS